MGGAGKFKRVGNQTLLRLGPRALRLWLAALHIRKLR
jgi:hypothetical protein